MRRTLLLGILLGILISAIAGVTLVATLPSDDEIQKMSLEELGLDEVAQDTFIGGIIEQFMAPVQERVRDRVVDDVYKSVALAAGLVVLVTAAGVVIISGDSRRRANSAEVPPPPS
jgi:hypothetical protein